jgi:hypothetical protein
VSSHPPHKNKKRVETQLHNHPPPYPMILTTCKGKGFPLPREIRVHVVQQQQHRSPVATFASAISLTAHPLLLFSLMLSGKIN